MITLWRSTRRTKVSCNNRLKFYKEAATRLITCYDMEVGENRVRVFYGTEKREKEKDSRYIQEASAPVAVTVYQICNMSPAHVHR